MYAPRDGLALNDDFNGRSEGYTSASDLSINYSMITCMVRPRAQANVMIALPLHYTP